MQKRNTAKQCEGSVLMETVLVIPLLMLILGGVLWVGQLPINRARLLVADRYLAWNEVNRNRNPGDLVSELMTQEEPRMFFDEPAVIGQRESLGVLRMTAPSRGHFWRFAAASVDMMVAAPVIVSALFAAPEVLRLEEDETNDLQMETLRSRRRHFVLALRQPDRYTGSRFMKPVHHGDRGLSFDSVKDEAWYVD